MVGEGPSIPFLATAPLSVAPRRRRRWAVPAAVAGTVAVAVVLGVLIFVPVAQSAPESLTLVNAGSVLSAVGQPITFPHGGTFDFHWATTNGATVTFSVIAPSGTPIYSSDSAGATLSLPVTSNGPYLFEIDDWLPATVAVSGTLHYTAPML